MPPGRVGLMLLILRAVHKQSRTRDLTGAKSALAWRLGFKLSAKILRAKVHSQQPPRQKNQWAGNSLAHKITSVIFGHQKPAPYQRS
tara:strand:- start:114 stop:374 length:261 start_codon:yes stop_codon:yes gene_type:complete